MDKLINKRCEEIFNGFRRCGYEIYAVGGCVRDSILDIKPKDIDFCTDATPEQMCDVYVYLHEITPIDIIPTGEKFGTLTFRFPEFDEQYEITTWRADGRYTDGRHPNEVSYAKTLEEDLKRRDFTCNAVAWNPIKGYVDPFNGRQDIENKIIKCVGNPEERFNEDALRIIRLVRFAIKYDFEIDMDTYTAAKKLIDNIHYVSKERIGAEFIKIFGYKYHTCYKKSKDYKTYDLLASLLRRVFPNCQSDEVLQDIVMWYKVPLLRWYGACEDKNEQVMTTFINQFAVGSDICNGVKNLKRAFRFLDYNTDGHWKDKQVLNIVRTPEERKALLSVLIDTGEDITDIVQAIVNDEPYSIKQLAVDGNWVMSYLDMKPGPQVKKALEDILDYVCQHPNKNEETHIKVFIDEKYKEAEVDE